MKSSNIESEKGCYKEAEKRVLARRKAKQYVPKARTEMKRMCKAKLDT